MGAPDPKIIVAMDFDSADQCMSLAKQLSPKDCRLKVGKELFTTSGPLIVEKLTNLGFDVFLDLKFHDIPNTTSKAIKAAADLGVWMVNVHASGGRRMMEACRNILDAQSGRKPLLIGVTVLTSMEQVDISEVGVSYSLEDHVLKLAVLAQQSGLDGIVCSAHESTALRSVVGKDFCLVTPGIRMIDSPADDQRRTMTPQEAMAAGSSYLVIGRPITKAASPAEVCKFIAHSLR
jgi:orotidine-5'-phosphate decarboxylase